jgi:hypothetical protein
MLVLNKKNTRTADVVLEAHDVHRSFVRNGKFYAQILDGLQDELIAKGFSCFTLARVGSKLIENAYGEVYYPYSIADYFYFYCSKIRIFGLKSCYGDYRVKYYSKMLDNAKAKIVIGIQPSRYLIKAAKLLNIPVVDLLHGYGIVKDHSFYGVESFKKKEQEYCCTDYVALDDFTKEILKSNILLANRKARIWSYLSPVLKDRSKIQDNNLSIFSNSHKKTFLITLQWGIERFESKYHHRDGELHPEIIKVIDLAEKEGFGFIIKPHPILLKNSIAIRRLSHYVKSRNNVFLDTNSSLASLLNIVSCHITIFSSSTREAAFLRRETLIFSSEDYLFKGDNSLFQCEIKYGIAQRVVNLSTLKIVDLLKSKVVFSKEDDYQKYKDNVMPEITDAGALVQMILDGHSLD